MSQGLKATERFKLRVIKDHIVRNNSVDYTALKHNICRASVYNYSKDIKINYPVRYKIYSMLGALNA